MCCMKTMFKSVALVAIAALSLAACSKKEAPINDENELITLKFNIKNADDASTRALLGTDTDGKKFLDWENGDKIGTFSVGVFPQGDNTYYTSNNNSGTVNVDDTGFTLNVQTFNAGEVTEIYSYFPYSASAGKDKTAAKVTVPETQTMTAEGFDADAMPMAGVPVEVDLATASANQDTPCGTINFCNLGSIINFRVYTSGSTSETLTSVTYKAPGIGGSFSIDLTRIDASSEATLLLTASETINEITTTCSMNPVIGSGLDNAIDVYMVVAPGSYTGSQVVVTTNAHTYTLDASGEKVYSRSHVKPMKIDISKGTQGNLPQAEIWKKVTTASDFIPGEYYILRGDGAYYLPNASTGNNAPACVAFTNVTPIPNAMRFTATAGDEGLVFESKVAPGNFLWGANTNNGIRVNSTYTASGASKEWSFATLSVGEDNIYYTASAVNGRYLVSYGNQDWRNYEKGTSSNIPAEFYRLDDGKTALPVPVLSVEGTVVSWDAVPNADHYVVSVSGNSTNINTTSYDLSGLSLADGEYKVSVVAAAPENSQYLNSRAASIFVTIGAPHGTEDNPYTVAEAIAAIDNGSTASDVYVIGIISEIVTAYNSSFGNVSFNISADGLTAGDQFLAFRAVAESAEEYVVGDGIIMKGTLTKYNSTYEFDAGCTKVDQVHKPSMTAGTSFADNQTVTITAESGASIRYTVDGTVPTATNGSDYSGALSLTETTTVKAIAIKNGMITAVVSETFTKNTSGGTLKDGSVSMTYSDSEGWTISGAGSGTGGGGYYILCTDAYIESPSFTFNSIKSITIKTRTCGGSQYKTTTVTFGSTTIGTIDASGSSLASKTLTVTDSPSGTGKIKFSSSTSGTQTQGPGIQEITINYNYYE